MYFRSYLIYLDNISYCIPCLYSTQKKLIMWTNFPFWMSGPNQTGHCNRAYGRKLPPCFKTALGTRTVSLDNKADLDIPPWKSHLQKPSKLSDKSATIGFWVIHLRALATQRSAFWGSMQKHLIKDAWRGGEGLSLDSFYDSQWMTSGIKCKMMEMCSIISLYCQNGSACIACIPVQFISLVDWMVSQRPMEFFTALSFVPTPAALREHAKFLPLQETCTLR